MRITIVTEGASVVANIVQSTTISLGTKNLAERRFSLKITPSHEALACSQAAAEVSGVAKPRRADNGQGEIRAHASVTPANLTAVR
jgi:hypothetical protein